MASLKTLESAKRGHSETLGDVLDALNWNDAGLIAAVAQEYETRDVLMLAWMDRTAVERTLNEGYACYYSRSRQTYWRKGESSGHVQRLVSMAFDCDGDAVLLEVEQEGPACHTNRSNCFYLRVEGNQVRVAAQPVVAD